MSRLYLILTLLALIGCSRDSGPSTTPSRVTTNTTTDPGPAPLTSQKKLRIAVIPKGTSHEFWKSVHAGALNAAKELGDVEIIWKGPATENDTSAQIELVKNMITQRVDAIVLAPNHSESLVGVVQEANEEKIPVVIFDSGLGQGPEIVSYVATNNENGGRLAAQRLAEALGDKGEVILLRYRAGSESTEQREAGFLAEIAKHPGIKVLSSDQYGDQGIKAAMDKSLQLLLRFQNEVDGVFAVCESNCNGMLEALEQSGQAGKVKFVAFDPADGLIKGLEEGKVHGIVLQDPVKMGYEGVKAAVAKLRNQPVEVRVSTGEYVATPDNMKSDQYQKLLHPQLAE